MSKKRVHEIAKELKGHGIELDNKEVVTELVSLGYDVKSHSSSLEDDQANAAVQKILDKRKPKQPVAPVAAKGFVVRRKGPATSADEGREAPSYAPPSVAEPIAARAEPAPEPEPVDEELPEPDRTGFAHSVSAATGFLDSTFEPERPRQVRDPNAPRYVGGIR